MTIISFMNMKGGVGKTTLCVNIANTLSTYSKEKVLLIDMDPQFNSSQYVLRVLHGKDHVKKYAEYKKQGKTIYSLYEDTHKPHGPITESKNTLFNTKKIDDSHLKKDYTVNVKKNFDMLLGDIDLLNLEINQKSGVESVLAKYLELSGLKSKYKYILIDSPPTYSVFFISSYITCDAYVLPVKPDYLSSTGIALMERAEGSIMNTFGIEKVALGVIYTLIDPRNQLHIPVQEDIEMEIGAKNIFKHELKYIKAIPEGLSTGKFMLDIPDYKTDSTIKSMTEELILKIQEKITS